MFFHDLIHFDRHITVIIRYEVDVHVIPYSSTVDAANKVKAPNIGAENFEEIYSFTQSLPFSGNGGNYYICLAVPLAVLSTSCFYMLQLHIQDWLYDM